MSWVAANFAHIWELTLTHVGLSVPPIILGFVLSVPLGWIAHRYAASRSVLLTVSGLLYTIPSLSLFLVLPAVLGTTQLDPANVVVAMTIYAVALMVRSAADGFGSVEPNVRQSAVAVGYSGWGRFWAVELPLAGPVLVAGMRVVSASTVSLISVGSLIGVSSLGYLFIDGLNRQFPTEIITGIVATIVIAVVFDLALVGLGRLLMPWTRSGAKAPRRRAFARTEAAA
ncbi:ABC transporter permease [Paramicrobacterium agarici]|uniref:Osmoprotectant transport system permease protein n=1 Tax=Paramicrobacterium agarici TaxID=630514 RepID=A0A2A9DW11_9MICO|nr:ABC transporter permease [Microbacterium agarici]PFG30325.1 osmoprotectant transport system permease protein [Microbacterium agarici]TQO23340.1 osmoprotectant transport system permease protein [Microbacterium agarici]